jgi:membrane-associated phospholipid phosphatase
VTDGEDDGTSEGARSGGETTDGSPSGGGTTDGPPSGGETTAWAPPPHPLPDSGIQARPARWRTPTVPIPSAIDRFDAAVDAWFDRHLRDRPAMDRLMYGASAVGDHGFLWVTLAAVQEARRPTRQLQPMLRAWAGLGIESALVNGPVKWMFRRTRPAPEEPRPWHLRQPRTSSFPSGHASSAFFGAALLRDGDPLWPLYYAAALVVAASRVYVKVHHASDVVGGIAIGVVLGELTRRLVPVGNPATKES